MSTYKDNPTPRGMQIEKFPRSEHQLQHDQPPPASPDAPVDIQQEIIDSGIRRQVVRLYGRTVDSALMELGRRAGRDPAKPNFRSCFPSQSRIATDIGCGHQRETTDKKNGRKKTVQTGRQEVNNAIKQLAGPGIIIKKKVPNPARQGTRTQYHIPPAEKLKSIAERLANISKETSHRPFPSNNVSVPTDTKKESAQADTKKEIASVPTDTPLSVQTDTCKINRTRRDGWMEDIDPSIQGLRAEEVALNRRMLTHPDVGISQAKADEIAVDYDARTVFAHCCRYINDHQQGDVRGPGALINRFDNPDKWPTPEITETAGSNFSYQYWQEVRNLSEIDATDEPATAHSDALNVSSPTDEAQIDPAPDDQPAQTPSEPGQVNFWNGYDNGSTNGADLWEKAKYELKLQMPATAYQQYAQDTEIIDYTAGTFIIGAPNKSARDFLNIRLPKTIPCRQAMSVLEKLTGQPVTLIFVDRSDPQDRPALAKRTAAVVGGSDDDEGEAAAVRPQPAPRLKERLRQLLADKQAQENNRIVHELQGRINALKAEQLTTAETQDRIDQLIADRIAVLEAEEEPPQDTAGTATLSPPSLGGSDDGQLDAAPDTTDTPGPPAAEQKAPDEPDYLRQAQDAERELKQARIKHSQRWRRDHRRRQSVSTWVPEYSSHHQNGTASQPVRAP